MATNFITTLDTFDKNVTEHTDVNVSATWRNPVHVANKIQKMNQNKDKIKEKGKDLDDLNQQISEISKQDNPDMATLSTLQKQRDELYNYLYDPTSGLETMTNKEYEEAKKFIKIFPKKNGKYEAQFETNEKPYTTIKVNGINDQFKNQSGSIHPKQQYMYDESTAGSIHNIIKAAKAGDWDSLQDGKDFTAIASAGFNLEGDAYNKLAEAIIDARFQYNIKRNFNEQLIDIRNIKNFRSSNIHEEARLKDVSTNGNNFINPATTDGSNASKSFYMSRNDFYWSQNFNDIQDQNGAIQRQSIPNIILNEYQPNLQYDMGRQIFRGLDEIAGEGTKALTQKALNKIGMGGMMGLVKAGVQHGTEKMYNDTLQEVGAHPERLYNEEHYEEFTNPMYYIEHLFTNGRWLNTYQLPFIDSGQVKTDYLKNSSDPGTWDIGGLTDGLGQNGLMQQVLSNKISLSLPTSPTFSLGNSHRATFGPFRISFYLINKDDFYLDKNFQFMQALFAGTQWLAMKYGAVVATNVYHVLVPGRFAIQWASLQSEFQAIGKLRTNQHMYANYNGKIGMIDGETLWPQAWSVSLTINPLSPWNFNTHMAYYLHGFGAAQRTRLAQMKTSWMNTGKTLENEKNEIENFEKRKNQIQQSLADLRGKLDDTIEDMDDAYKKGDMDRFNKLKEKVKKQRQNYYNEYEEAKAMENEINEAMQEAGLGNKDTLESQNVTNQIAQNTLQGVDNRLTSRARGWGKDGQDLRFLNVNDEQEVKEEIEQSLEDAEAANRSSNATITPTKPQSEKTFTENATDVIGTMTQGDEYWADPNAGRNMQAERRLSDQTTVYEMYNQGKITEQERDFYLNQIQNRRIEESTRRQLAQAKTQEEKEEIRARQAAETAKVNTKYEYKKSTGRNYDTDVIEGNLGKTQEQIDARQKEKFEFNQKRDELLKQASETEDDNKFNELQLQRAQLQKQETQRDYEWKMNSVDFDVFADDELKAARRESIEAFKDKNMQAIEDDIKTYSPVEEIDVPNIDQNMDAQSQPLPHDRTEQFHQEIEENMHAMKDTLTQMRDNAQRNLQALEEKLQQAKKELNENTKVQEEEMTQKQPKVQNTNRYAKQTFKNVLTIPQQMKVTNGSADFETRTRQNDETVEVDYRYVEKGLDRVPNGNIKEGTMTFGTDYFDQETDTDF